MLSRIIFNRRLQKIGKEKKNIPAFKMKNVIHMCKYPLFEFPIYNLKINLLRFDCNSFFSKVEHVEYDEIKDHNKITHQNSILRRLRHLETQKKTIVKYDPRKLGHACFVLKKWRLSSDY